MDAKEPSAVRALLELAAYKIRIAPEGGWLCFGILMVALAAWLIGLTIVAAVLFAAALAVSAFFRDPERLAPANDRMVISAADGRVVEIAERSFSEVAAAPLLQVSIFMSPLNVHVNRAPVSGEVARIEHTPGDFKAAFSDHASEHNERNLIVFTDRHGRRHGVVQVAGYLARRIVCRVRNRDKISQGQRIGLIMFGSRVDHLFTLEYAPRVKIGDRVRAGESVLGELQQ